jgi:hypothetical protein
MHNATLLYLSIIDITKYLLKVSATFFDIFRCHEITNLIKSHDCDLANLWGQRIVH